MSPAAHAQPGQNYASDSPSQQAAEMSVVLCTAGCECLTLHLRTSRMVRLSGGR